ncbi:hypothetical protein C1645_783343 [Glomus cerebriforme]|uniref:Uncharacterized protein n=1 Tax=Glomus cerebriforme TaxID=658196 RepID=A0A397SPM1_9GLOM|nr:hypothetical protein C1645_783343 [Glomus cerebriforme]
MLPQAYEFGGLTLFHKIHLLFFQLNILYFYLFCCCQIPLSLKQLQGLFCFLL